MDNNPILSQMGVDPDSKLELPNIKPAATPVPDVKPPIEPVQPSTNVPETQQQVLPGLGQITVPTSNVEVSPIDTPDNRFYPATFSPKAGDDYWSGQTDHYSRIVRDALQRGEPLNQPLPPPLPQTNTNPTQFRPDSTRNPVGDFFGGAWKVLSWRPPGFPKVDDLVPSKEFNPLQFKFKDFGTGSFGAAMYLLNMPQNLVVGAATDINQLITTVQGKPTALGDKPQVIQGLLGKSFDFTNLHSVQNPLSVVGGKEPPKTFGELYNRSPVYWLGSRILFGTIPIEQLTQDVAKFTNTPDVKLPQFLTNKLAGRSYFQYPEFAAGLVLNVITDPTDLVTGLGKVPKAVESATAEAPEIVRATIPEVVAPTPLPMTPQALTQAMKNIDQEAEAAVQAAKNAATRETTPAQLTQQVAEIRKQAQARKAELKAQVNAAREASKETLPAIPNTPAVLPPKPTTPTLTTTLHQNNVPQVRQVLPTQVKNPAALQLPNRITLPNTFEGRYATQNLANEQARYANAAAQERALLEQAREQEARLQQALRKVEQLPYLERQTLQTHPPVPPKQPVNINVPPPSYRPPVSPNNPYYFKDGGQIVTESPNSELITQLREEGSKLIQTARQLQDVWESRPGNPQPSIGARFASLSNSLATQNHAGIMDALSSGDGLVAYSRYNNYESILDLTDGINYNTLRDDALLAAAKVFDPSKVPGGNFQISPIWRTTAPDNLPEYMKIYLSKIDAQWSGKEWQLARLKERKYFVQSRDEALELAQVYGLRDNKPTPALVNPFNIESNGIEVKPEDVQRELQVILQNGGLTKPIEVALVGKKGNFALYQVAPTYDNQVRWMAAKEARAQDLRTFENTSVMVIPPGKAAGWFYGEMPGIPEFSDIDEYVDGLVNMGIPRKPSEALSEYIFDGSKAFDINSKLRKGEALSPDEAALSKDMDTALDSLPVYQGVTYRGVTRDPGLKVGDTYVDKGYMSTSKELAPTYAARPVQFEVRGITGVDIYNAAETEVLFKRGTEFKVTSVIDRKGTRIYVLEEIPKSTLKLDVYHGTRVVDHQFPDPVAGASRSELGTGHYFTTDPQEARLFAEATPHRNSPLNDGDVISDNSGFIYNADIELKNPIDANAVGEDKVRQAFIIGARKAGLEKELVTQYGRELKKLPVSEYFSRFDELAENLTEDVRLSFQRDVSRALGNAGYDGIVHQTQGGSTWASVFNPASINRKGVESVPIANDLQAAEARYVATQMTAKRMPGNEFSHVDAVDGEANFKARLYEDTQAQLRAAQQETEAAMEALTQAEKRLESIRQTQPEIQLPRTTPLPIPVANVNKPVFIKAELTLTESAKEANRLHNILQASATPNADPLTTALAQRVARYEDIWQREVGEVAELDPNNYDRVGTFLANNFNQKAAALGLSPNTYSQPGEIRYTLVELKRIAEGMIDSAAKYMGVQKLKELRGSVGAMVKQKGLPPDITKKLMGQLQEMGQYAKLLGVYQSRPAGIKYLQDRYQTFAEGMTDLGFSPTEIDDLMEIATQVAGVFDEVKLAAQALGVAEGDLEGIARWYSMLTKEGQIMVASQLNKSNVLLTEVVKNNNIEPFLRRAAMASDKWLPESEALLSKELGLTIDELRTLVSDTPAFVTKLEELSPDKLTRLIDTGLLTRVPASSSDLFNYVVQRLELPVKQLNELFLTDPEKAVQAYANYAKRLSIPASTDKFLTTDGVKAGWLSTEQLDGWVKYPGDEGLYMHPMTADIYKAVFEMPLSHQNTFLSILANTFGFFSKAALIDYTYVARVLYSDFVQAAAAGTNLLRIPEAMADMAKLKYLGLSAFDDTQKIYRGWDGELITKRQLVELFVRHRSADLAPQMEGYKAVLEFEALNPINIKRGLNYLNWYKQHFGTAKAVGRGFGMVSSMQKEAGAVFAVAAAYLESSHRLATLYSYLDTSSANLVGQFLRPAVQLPDFKAALRRVDDYFFTGDDAGRVPKFVGTYVRPFANYAFMNPPAQLRHALRNPQVWMNYWRIRAFMNEPAASDPYLPEGGVPRYVLESQPMFLNKVTDGYFVLMTNSIDPVSEAWNYANSSNKEVARQLGLYVGTSAEQREQLRDKPSVTTYIADLLKDTHPIWKLVVGAATGKDVDTGRDLDPPALREQQSFLGARVHPLLKNILSIYPPISKLDRLNPGDAFGIAEIRDPRTNEIVVQGRPSFLGVERTKIELDKYDPRMQQWGIKLARTLGFNIKLVDLPTNMQLTLSDIESTSDEIERNIVRSGRELRDNPPKDAGEYNRLVAERTKAIEQWFQLKMDMARVQQWMLREKIPHKDYWNKLKSQQNQALPQPAGSEVQRQLERAIQLRQQVKESN